MQSQRAGDRRRKAICPLFSSCSCFPPLDSSLVLLLWNFGVEPSFGEHFGFGRIWRRSLKICWSATFDLGEGGNASPQFLVFPAGGLIAGSCILFFPLPSGFDLLSGKNFRQTSSYKCHSDLVNEKNTDGASKDKVRGTSVHLSDQPCPASPKPFLKAAVTPKHFLLFVTQEAPHTFGLRARTLLCFQLRLFLLQ